jgi:penicillin-binding protein 1A
LEVEKPGMKRRILKALKILAIAGGILVLGVVLLYLAVLLGIFGRLPDKEQLKEITNEQASLIYSSDEVLIGKIFAENRTEIGEVPPHLKQALISTEDKRFYEHKGYDTRSYLRVLFRSILLGDRSGGGGSTISQQLAKNLFGRPYHGFLSMPVNKIREAIVASRMEDVYSKEEILLLYLNSVPFGENTYGIEAASFRYFNKKTAELNIEQSALLVGLLKANTAYNPRLHPEAAQNRRNTVLSLMAAENYITVEEADSLQLQPLWLDYTN